jgi:hypothetical protein
VKIRPFVPPRIRGLVPTGVESGVTAPDIKSTKLGTAVVPAYSGSARIAPHRPEDP